MVGENGSGKTTLLRVLAGELGVDPSMLRRIPAGLIATLIMATLLYRRITSYNVCYTKLLRAVVVVY